MPGINSNFSSSSSLLSLRSSKAQKDRLGKENPNEHIGEYMEPTELWNLDNATPSSWTLLRSMDLLRFASGYDFVMPGMPQGAAEYLLYGFR